MNTSTTTGHDLVDAYLAELRRTLRGQSDAEDLIAELADHLCESVDLAIAKGTDPTVAQQVAIARLGEPVLVARALVSARTRRLAQPTSGTIAAGRLGGVAAILWVAIGLAQFLASEVVLNVPDGPVGQSIFGAAIAAIAATGLVILGVSRRSGGRRDVATLTVTVCGILAVVAGAAMMWFFILWGGLLSIAALVADRQRARVRLDAPSMLPLVLAWPVGTAVVLIGQIVGWGPAGHYEDHPLAIATGLAVGCALAAIGCAVTARRLAAEKTSESELAAA
ncbi:MAG: permease prefix domain 1-containing protein [Propionicimonas sp.]